MIMSKKKEIFQVEMRREKRQEIISRKRRDISQRNNLREEFGINVDVEKQGE